MIKSVRGGHAEDEVCPSDGKDWSFSVEAGYILQDGAIASSGNPHCAKSGHLLEASA